MSKRTELAIGALLALVSTTLTAIGAPPSEFASQGSAWWRVEFLMLPALAAGVLLAFLSVLTSWLPSGPLPSAWCCLLGCAASCLGLIVASGISAQPTIRGLTIPLFFLGGPAAVAVDVIRHKRATAALPQGAG